MCFVLVFGTSRFWGGPGLVMAGGTERRLVGTLLPQREKGGEYGCSNIIEVLTDSALPMLLLLTRSSV